MPVFPRGAKAMPRLVSPPRFPGGLQSWGMGGKGQFRSVQNMGRVWTETYPILDTSLATVRAFLEAVNRSMRAPIVWDVQHVYWQRRLGAGGGTPLVAGADQVGSTLNIDGASAGVTNWLRAGDLLVVAGGAVVYDVTADVNTDGGGAASIPIHPPIYAGGSPADNAALTIDPAAIYFKAVLAEVAEFPDIDVTGYMDAGLTLTWREQPA